MEPRHRVRGIDAAKQILQHVGEVYADIEQDPAMLTAVPPHADGHPVAAAHTVLDDEPRHADRA